MRSRRCIQRRLCEDQDQRRGRYPGETDPCGGIVWLALLHERHGNAPWSSGDGAGARATTPGTTCRCSPASPAPCATALRSRIGCCRQPWSESGASSPVPTMGIGRWSTSSPRCSPTGCQRSKLPAPRRSRWASTPPTSSSTSWLASATRPAGHDSHADRADATPCAYCRLRPLQQPQENQLMERTRLHVPLLRIVGASTAPTSTALPCRRRSRPQHQRAEVARSFDRLMMTARRAMLWPLSGPACRGLR